MENHLNAKEEILSPNVFSFMNFSDILCEKVPEKLPKNYRKHDHDMQYVYCHICSQNTSPFHKKRHI